MLRILKNKTNLKSIRSISSFKDSIIGCSKERLSQNIAPKILDTEQVNTLCDLLLNPPDGEEDFLKYQFKHRILPGVDDTSRIKASFLDSICKKEKSSPLITDFEAVKVLGTMQGGYNIKPLINLLENENLAEYAAEELKKTILIFDYFHDVEDLAKKGNIYALDLLKSWSNAEWFLNKDDVPEKVTLTVFKVSGETNTDDLSPAPDAWSRPDIPLHALSMLKNSRDGIIPDEPGIIGPLGQINELKKLGHEIVYTGDVVGTGSSRKSATNSILWYFGKDIPYVPNKRTGGYCIGGKIAPIFFNTMEDSGALPLEMTVDELQMGDVIDIYPHKGLTTEHNSDKVISEWYHKSETILDSVRSGGRINLIIGKSLTNKSREYLNLNESDVFRKANNGDSKFTGGYTLAQKMVGKACGLPEGDGILPGTYCEPKTTSVGSQDTTGPMTRDELKDLACLGFSSDLVMQSFCHTAAYPKPVDVLTHATLPEFINSRGGISLKPGDGIIHSWLNRMLLPDTVGTGGDSHTRFPIGISFPAGSGLVAFAATTGVMPLDMPESVLVKFTGTMQKGITLRDLVHAIPYYAKKKGLLTIEKKGKINVFSGRILEIEGLPDLTCEQAFELSDASAERSAAGCTIKLNKEPVIEYLESNISLLNWMISEGYNDNRTIQRRIDTMKKWLESPDLIEADKDASYHEVIEINMDEITEPILCAPNDPDDAVLLSEVSEQKIEEVFIGSCMTNIGHFRAAGKLLESFEGQLPTRLWMAPPTKMDEKKLIDEGFYSIYGKVGARTEMPGCSLCMGNQARVADNSWVLSTSTRNFPNRLGKGANVFLASAELSAITAIEGKIPNINTYMEYFNKIENKKDEIFTYMNFDKLKEYN